MSFFKLAAIALTLVLMVTAVAWATTVQQDHQSARAIQMQRQAATAAKLAAVKELPVLRKKAHAGKQTGRRVREQPEREISDLKRMLEILHRKENALEGKPDAKEDLKHIRREANRIEKLLDQMRKNRGGEDDEREREHSDEDVEEEREWNDRRFDRERGNNFENESGDSNWGDADDEGDRNDEDEEVEDLHHQLQHMHAAIEHLHEAGLDEIADHVQEIAVEAERELEEHEHHGEEMMHKMMERIEELSEEMEQLQAQMRAFRKEK